jgi:hypothetical protein
LKLGHRLIEIDKPGLFSFIENGKRAGNLQPSANCFLPSRLLVDEQYIGVHLGCERDCLAFAGIELRKSEVALGTENFHPLGPIGGPILYRLRRKRMLELRQYSRWNQNSRVQMPEKIDLPDQDEVVDRRCVRDDDCRERAQR